MSNFEATNNFNSSAFIFYERLKFKLRAYEGKYHTNIKELNFSDLNKYGRVDESLNPIILDTRFLLNIGSNFAAGFVVEAFKDLRRHFQNANQFSFISLNEKFLSNLECHQGYEDPIELYNEYINEIMSAYNDIFIETSEVRDYKTYVNNFIHFKKHMGSDFPFTFSSWVKSARCSPFISGLMINVSNNEFGNDILKEKDFLNSSNFDFYVNACKSRGFYVLKQNPSILIADIGSLQLNRFLKKSNLGTATDVLTRAYSPAHLSDIEYLTSKLNEYYNELITNNKRIVDIKVSRNNTTYLKITNRNLKYNININNILYKLYINIRNIEEDYVFGQPQVDKMIRDSKKIEKRFDRERAIDYINREFGSTFASKYGGIRYYKKKFNLLEDK